MERLIRRPDVLARSGLSSSTLNRLEKDGKFPARRKIAPNCVAWIEREVGEWIESKVKGGGNEQCE